MSRAFTNQAPLDFSLETNRSALQAALVDLEQLRQKGALKAAPVINGSEISSDRSFKREDPSHYSLTLGEIYCASSEQSAAAVKALKAAYPAWCSTPVSKRAEILNQIAETFLKHRLHLTALLIRESGKPWLEADAEFCEAVDFCRYYAEEALILSERTEGVRSLPGESNLYQLRGKGVAAIIAPWNFPLAILCGMAVGALVMGNTVALKPAEQSSLIGAALFRVLLEAGVPESVIALLPGTGEEVGRTLVDQPEVALIAFTGSRSVGLEIMQRTLSRATTSGVIPKVLAELGGKNCLIIDEDADLDEALIGVLHSSFGFAGQKCSACSRVVAVGSCYERLVERLIEAAPNLALGPSQNPGTIVGPVIDRESFERISKTIELTSTVAIPIVSGVAPKTGYFIAPTIFTEPEGNSAESRAAESGSPWQTLWREEIFGPVLAVRKANSFSEALALANDSQYALTGGIFSRSPKNIELAKSSFDVGNLYINRGITGAIVGRQPFGGHKLSGVGAKAGGPHYLAQFADPITICENTMRKGFTPDL